MVKGGALSDYVVEKGTLSEEEASVLLHKIASAWTSFLAIGTRESPSHQQERKSPGAEIKLINFGLAKVVQRETVASSFLGTKGYMH